MDAAIKSPGMPSDFDDAGRAGDFAKDAYLLAHKPQSVLCIPLVRHGKFEGAIYMENSLASGVFTEERIEILKLLSGQIGVSIANAELYEKLEEKVRLRTAQLETRNRFISQTFGRYLSDEIVEVLLEASEVDVLDPALAHDLLRGLLGDDAEASLRLRQRRLDLEVVADPCLVGENLAHLRGAENVAEDDGIECRGGHGSLQIISTGVGRVPFNPPSRMEWRVKANPPYSCFMESRH